MSRLALRPGDRALDLGCGTGLSLPLLRAAVGSEGVVYGVELSPDMLARARRRVEQAGWRNVTLYEANAETFELPEAVQGILCFYTHDILLSPTALPRAVGLLVPGGRVVAVGGKLVHGWRGLINPITVAYSLPAVTSRDASLLPALRRARGTPPRRPRGGALAWLPVPVLGTTRRAARRIS